ncbi:MAG: diguanylate cyclase [Planctomycetes bacterium]|nr:diguanylate cyclase [Planctomycetota bacterium]
MSARKINILLVDDDPGDCRLTKLALENSSQEMEFIVETAAMLKECLEYVKTKKCDLVLLDLGLPDSHGVANVEKVHEANPEVPIIVLTGLDDEEIGVKAIKKGAIDYIIKPFNQSVLRTRISIAIKLLELQEQLQLRANTDELTGLANRRHFFEILEREILRTKMKGTPLAVFMLDLDHFKNINDTYGHLGGDTVLKQMGKILVENIYPLDIAGRYGGDEFIILMPGVTFDEATRAAQRLQKVVSKYQWKIFDKKISNTISVGLVSVDSSDLPDSNEIVDRADKALYAAKQNGRNCVVRWDQIDPDKGVEKPEDEGVDYSELQNKLSSVVGKLHSQIVGIVTAFTKVMAIKDPYISNHTRHVQIYAAAIAEELGLSEELKERLNTASVLHDLGKIGIPDRILTKTESLTKEELKIVRNYPLVSVQILEPIGIFSHELDIIRQHHEKFDGTGYPERLKGKEISIGGRVLAIANFYDSITSDRCYRPALSTEKALGEIIKESQIRFDSDVVEAFEKAYDKNKEQWPLSAKSCLVETV